jgi:hypothetical protein
MSKLTACLKPALAHCRVATLLFRPLVNSRTNRKFAQVYLAHSNNFTNGAAFLICLSTSLRKHIRVNSKSSSFRERLGVSEESLCLSFLFPRAVHLKFTSGALALTGNCGTVLSSI